MDNSVPQVPQEVNQPIPQQPIQPPINSSTSSLKRIIFIIVAVVLLVTIAGGSYLLGTKNNKTMAQPSVQTQTIQPILTPSPTITSNPTIDPTANWKTYTSTTYKFSIKYPASLTADDQHASPPSVLIEPAQTQTGAPGLPNFYISVENNPAGSNEMVYDSLPQQDVDALSNAKVGDSILLSGHEKDTYADYWYFKRLPDVTVDNVTGVVGENSKVWSASGSKQRVVIVKKDKIYLIGTYYRADSDLNNFQLLLSTFKFTN